MVGIVEFAARASQKSLTMDPSDPLKKVFYDTSTQKFYVDNGVELDLQEYQDWLAEQPDDIQVNVYYLWKYEGEPEWYVQKMNRARCVWI